MRPILQNTDFHLSSVKNLRILRQDPHDIAGTATKERLSGHLSMSDKDLYYFDDTKYHAIVTEDTSDVGTNLVQGEDFVFNRWYYFKHGQTSFTDNINDAHLIACNDNHYLMYQVSGLLSALPEHNELNVDMRKSLLNDVRVLVEYSLDRENWIEFRYYQATLSGDNFNPTIPLYFLKPESHVYIRIKVYNEGYPFQEIEVYDEDDEYFTLSMRFWRKPRLSWKAVHHYDSTPFLPETTFTFRFPSSGLRVPFEGYYRVEAMFETIEADINQDPVNCSVPQSLVFSGDGAFSTTVDISPTFTPIGTAAGSIMTPNSVQGSALVYATEYINFQVFLPNGQLHKVVGGYAAVQFVGDYMSPSVLI